jgi:hypothetical protein
MAKLTRKEALDLLTRLGTLESVKQAIDDVRNAELAGERIRIRIETERTLICSVVDADEGIALAALAAMEREVNAQLEAADLEVEPA